MEKINLSQTGLQDLQTEIKVSGHYIFAVDMRKMDSDIDITHDYIFTDRDVNAEIEYRFVTDPQRACKSRVKLIAKEGIKGISAHLTMKVLIIGKTGSSTLMPILEVEENEVELEHSASIGGVDKETLYYMQSRGITRELAEQLIADSFINL